jgi:hypothetical protein
MRFVFGYAGIPFDVFDDIKKKEKSLASGENTELIFLRPPKPSAPVFSESNVRFLQEKFKKITIEERESSKSPSHYISDIGFSIIYVRKNQENQENNEWFEDKFFPSTLVFSVDWNLTGCNTKEINESKNELLKLLLQATTNARETIKIIGKEITECRNRTPLLLPVKNFHSKALRSQLKTLQITLANQPDKVALASVVKETIDLIKTIHPLKKVENPKKKQPCFLDERDIEFHSPGSALHGLPRPQDNHPVSCLLGGYRRLGAPFHAAFHYDCVKGVRGNLKDSFYSCHEDASTIEGNPHLNISPNDFVRV